MKRFFSLLSITLFSCTIITACVAQTGTTKQIPNPVVKEGNYNPLTPQQRNVILNKATDRPYTGDYYDKKDEGIYICAQCNNPLYTSKDKFDSHCGWPSFDDEIEGSVTNVPDADGMRTEIICNNCKGHLGHIFVGEQFTDKNTRHCVNTSSIVFIPAAEVKNAPAVIRPRK